MKRIGYLFEKLIDKDNLRLAIKNASKGKSKYNIVKRIEKKMRIGLILQRVITVLKIFYH